MIEAMATGTPVIAYNRGSVSEIVKDGVTGFIIDQDESDRPKRGQWTIKKTGVEGLMEAVKRLGEVDRRATRAHIETYFTARTMAKGYEQVYQKVLEDYKKRQKDIVYEGRSRSL
jgi:glycosyltransferase involved in cell wall biosynthesis